MNPNKSFKLITTASFTFYNKVRLLKVILATLFVLLVVLLLLQWLLLTANSFSYPLLFTLAFVAFLYYWLTPDTSNIVTGITLWGLLVLSTYISWAHLGLFNASIFIYPCIVMIAYMLGSRALYIPIGIFIFLVILLLAGAHQVSMINLPTLDNATIWLRAIYLLIVLSFFSFIMLMFSRNIKRLTNRLINHNKRLHQKINCCRQQVNYDKITQLANENLAQSTYQKLFTSLGDSKQLLAFHSIDIHNLRTIHNIFGYEVSEIALKAFAERLSTLVNDTTFLYRFEGQEFVALKLAKQVSEIHAFKEQLIQAANLPFYIHDFEVELQISIGIAIAPKDADNLSSLRQKSHIALYHGDNKRRNSSYFFEPQLQQALSHKQALLIALKKALLNDEFELFFQPNIHLASGEVIGAEAFVRWHRPNYGYIMPNDFIPLTEESGLIVELSSWVIKEACLACKAWQKVNADFFISINLSAVNFRKGNLPHIIFKELQSADLSAKSLRLELSETIFVDESPYIREQLVKLHQQGIALVIDDFGTGYSNLHILQQVNICSVKIDRAIINKITQSEHDLHIAQAVIAISQSLGFGNIAKGVENQETLLLLQQLACEVAQGYFLCKPLTQQDFSTWLAKHQLAHASS